MLPARAARRTEDGRPDAIALPGVAGETARAFHWADDPPRAALSPDELARRLRAPPDPAIRDAAAAWLRDLPPGLADPRDMLDLAYVEQRLGGWDAPGKYLFPGRHRANVSVMASALAIETMLRLPLEDRRRGTLQRAIVAHGWPEFLTWPFNEPVDWLRPWALAYRAEQGLRGVARRALQRRSTGTPERSGGV